MLLFGKMSVKQIGNFLHRSLHFNTKWQNLMFGSGPRFRVVFFPWFVLRRFLFFYFFKKVLTLHKVKFSWNLYQRDEVCILYLFDYTYYNNFLDIEAIWKLKFEEILTGDEVKCSIFAYYFKIKNLSSNPLFVSNFYAKLSKTLAFYTLICTRTCADQWMRNVSFWTILCEFLSNAIYCSSHPEENFVKFLRRHLWRYTFLATLQLS